MALPSYQYRGVGGQDIDAQRDTSTVLAEFPLSVNLHTAEQGLQNLHKFYTIILWQGKTKKSHIFGLWQYIYYHQTVEQPWQQALLSFVAVVAQKYGVFQFVSKC